MFAVYADEDSAARAIYAQALRAGIDWLRARDAGMAGAADEAQLEFATANNRAILTANRRDFMRLHTEWMLAGRHHAGIIVITDQQTPPGLLWRKLLILQSRSTEEMRDAIIFVTNTPIGDA